MQAEAELSRFDDDARRIALERGAYASDVRAARDMEFMTGRVDAYFDPQNPHADWSGMVPTNAYSSRKAVVGAQGAQMHIERTAEGGIVAKDEFHEKAPGGKKHWADDCRFATESQVAAAHAGSDVGGWGAPAPDAGNFVTSSQLAARGAATEREFYGSETKRRGKKQICPAYDLKGPYHRASPILGGGAAQPPPRRAPPPKAAVAQEPHRVGSLAGYRSRQFNANSPGMLASAARGIAQKVKSPVVSHAPDSWHGSGTTKEVFDTSNFRDPSAIVGYTGHRS